MWELLRARHVEQFEAVAKAGIVLLMSLPFRTDFVSATRREREASLIRLQVCLSRQLVPVLHGSQLSVGNLTRGRMNSRQKLFTALFGRNENHQFWCSRVSFRLLRALFGTRRGHVNGHG